MSPDARVNPDISYDSSRGGLSRFMARHVSFALRRRVCRVDWINGAEDRGAKHNAAMEGQFAIDSAAAAAESDEICGLALAPARLFSTACYCCEIMQPRVGTDHQ